MADVLNSQARLELEAIGAALDSANQGEACITLAPLLDGFAPDLFTDELRGDAMRAVLEAVKTGNPVTVSMVPPYMKIGGSGERVEVLSASLKAYAGANAKLTGAPGYLEALEAARADRTGNLKRVTTKGGAIVPASPPPKLHAISAADLVSLDIQPVQWTVDEILPEGLSILAGREKQGKSWLALQLAHSVATGSEFLGRQCRRGAAVYLDLESGQRRPRERMISMFGVKHIPANLYFVTGEDDVRRVDDGLIIQLEDLIKRISNLCLIVVDVLQLVKPTGKRGQNAYEADYMIFGILRKFLATHPGLSLLVVTHLNKGGEITGSTANRGAMDAILQLARADGLNSAEGTLRIEGRDFKQGTQELALEWQQSPPAWICRGSVTDREEAQRASEYINSPVVRTIKRGLEVFDGKYMASASKLREDSQYWKTNIHWDVRAIGQQVTLFSNRLEADGISVSRSNGGRAGRAYTFTKH